jgi:hypothetical protein
MAHRNRGLSMKIAWWIFPWRTVNVITRGFTMGFTTINISWRITKRDPKILSMVKNIYRMIQILPKEKAPWPQKSYSNCFPTKYLDDLLYLDMATGQVQNPLFFTVFSLFPSSSMHLFQLQWIDPIFQNSAHPSLWYLWLFCKWLNWSTQKSMVKSG